jgi:hypothetical protein
MDEGEFKQELAARTTPEAVFDNAKYIYPFLGNLFGEPCNDSVLREWAFQWSSEQTGGSYDEIYNRWLADDESSKDFVVKFAKLIEKKGGDTFFSSGDYEQDEKMIKGTIDHQGYWAGNQFRYFFDSQYRFVKMEERKFGIS